MKFSFGGARMPASMSALAFALYALLALPTAAAQAAPDILKAASNGREVAYSYRAPGGSVYVSTKGRPSGPYEAVVGLSWSPDGSRVAYQAKSGGAWRVYDGAQASEGSDDFGQLLWSPDGSTPAWAAPTNGSWFVHRGRDVFGPYEDVVDLGFAGRSLCWNAKMQRKWYVCADGAAAGPFDSIEAAIVSKDGSRRAAVAHRGEDEFLCRGASAFGPWSEVMASWGRDGGLLYSYADDGKAWFCADQVQRGPYDEVRWDGPYSPGASDVWAARLGEKWYSWAAGKKQGPFDEVSFITRGPDGKGLHYVTRTDDQYTLVTGKNRYGPFFTDIRTIWNDGRSEFMPVEEAEEGQYLIDDETRIGPYKGIYGEASPSGKSRVVLIEDSDYNTRFVLPGGKVSEPYARSSCWPLVWTKDETRCAFTVETPETEDNEGEARSYVFDGSAMIGPFTEPQGLVWSDDGKRLAFWTQEEDGDGVYVGDREVMRVGRGYLELAFSPGGAKLLCVSREGWSINSASTVRIGQAEYGPYLDVGGFSWSSDGMRAAWKARDAAGARLVVDGKALGTYEDLRGIAWAGDAVVFEGYRDGAWRSRVYARGADRPGCKVGERAWYMDGAREVVE